MFLSSVSSSFLTLQFDHSDTANLRTLWTALRVVYGFVQAKALKFLLRLFIQLHVVVVTAFICDVVRFSSWDC